MLDQTYPESGLLTMLSNVQYKVFPKYIKQFVHYIEILYPLNVDK
ncbi:unnamed protein product [Schistosoma mattheei]|uniref:Uncharacterized protein n=1 Tax=Schistosoma mattheei TaxID=31246 RepID=A0A183PWN8_9TREM|nr:unnamed protein product [Schistosoma mattheei]